MSKTSTISHASSLISSSRVEGAEVHDSKGYKVLEGSRTVSKSIQSKIKNLAYTLSVPFRALMRQTVQGRVGGSANSAGVINIKSTPPSRPLSAENKMEPRSNPGLDYEVIEIKEGFGRHSLFGRIWG